eukprot:GHVS01104372.1.p1 GENE.GHVS01104372.1~~GHVS01104372.1.p1  ORF type:complete len:203 (+),score=32.55 GHVS01104372.1:21-629(+)
MSLVEYGYDSGEEEEILEGASTQNLTPRDALNDSNTPSCLPLSGRLPALSERQLCDDLAGGSPLRETRMVGKGDGETGSGTKASESVDVEMEDARGASSGNVLQEDRDHRLMPQPPSEPPSEALLRNINNLLELRRGGRTVNRHIMEGRSFQNPYLLEKIMGLFSIEPYCSNFPPELFDPSKYQHMGPKASVSQSAAHRRHG